MRLFFALVVLLAVAGPTLAVAGDGAGTIKGSGIAMHGQPKYGPGFTHFDYVNPDAPKGGTVRLAATGSFDNLNPFIIKGEAAVGLGNVYDTLMVSSADEPFSEYGLLAKSIETPKDRSWVQFVLRKEARWHDGQPITADDVVFSFNILRTKGSPFYRFYYANVAKVEKIDTYTVRFSFKPGDNHELPLILGQLTVLPKHYWQGRDFTATTLKPPLGSGPYRVKSLEQGRRIVYERVRDYWGRNLPVNVGRYNFDTISYDYYRDSTVQLEAFKAGAFDFRVENSAKDWATGYDIPAVHNHLLIKADIPEKRPAGMQAFAYNIRRPIFQDDRVRNALAYAFDFEWSNKNLFYGEYTRTRSYFSNSDLAATGLPGPDELKVLDPFRGKIPDAVFTRVYEPPKTDGTGRIRPNLRIADELLKQAGWVVRDFTRVNAKTGQPLEFTITLVSPAFERVVLPFIQNLKRLGVIAHLRTVDSAQYQRLLETFDFDMIVAVWGESDSPGNEQRLFWGSAAADQRGSQNYIGIKNPVIDALIEEIVAAPDRQGLVTRVHALDRVLQWNHYVIPQFHLTYDRVAYWDFFGFPKVIPPQGMQFDAWWVVPPKLKTLESKMIALRRE